MSKVELLAPVGDWDCLKAAVQNGADAVYFGVEQFNARMYAKNFNIDDMKQVINYCKLRNVKTNLTLNTLIKNCEFENAIDLVKEAYVAGIDAIIVQDFGLAKYLIDNFPHLPIHASTQMTVHNLQGVLELEKLGFDRVVLSRELSCEEIEYICKNCNVEIETFIHGALCICYSGQCLFSSVVGGRSGNRGKCAGPCRLPYELISENNSTHEIKTINKGYLLSTKDLCGIAYIQRLIQAGVKCFKIEGRMKTALYVATVVRTYRLAIDDFIEDPEKYKARIPFYKSEISKCTYRQYTTGFFFGKPDENTQIYDSNTYIREYTYLGIVGDTNEQGLYHIEQRNKFSVGETIEVMKPDGQNIEVTVKRIVDENGKDMDSCPHPKQNLYIDLGIQLDKYDILRRQEEETEVNS